MFKKTVKFENFLGEKVEKDFYFHMSKADLIRMAASGGMEARLKRIIASRDNEAIFKEFEDIIKMSVGVRSEDGETFIKDAAAQSQLLDSPAYDELMVELCTDANAASEFIAQLLPEKLQKELRAQINQIKSPTPGPFKEMEDKRPAWMKEHRHPTEAELASMSADELRAAILYKQGL